MFSAKGTWESGEGCSTVHVIVIFCRRDIRGTVYFVYTAF